MMSQSGDSIYLIGLLWLALELSGSESVTGLVAMASYMPAMLLALFAGVAADRGDRKRIMLAADGFRALTVLGVPLALGLERAAAGLNLLGRAELVIRKAVAWMFIGAGVFSLVRFVQTLIG